MTCQKAKREQRHEDLCQGEGFYADQYIQYKRSQLSLDGGSFFDYQYMVKKGLPSGFAFASMRRA